MAYPLLSPRRMLRWRTAVVAFCIALALALPSVGVAESVRERAATLARDPAHNGQITRTSRREAMVGLQLEKKGLLPGPIRREHTGHSEFVDGRGVRWDVKAFDSRWPVGKGGFVLEEAMAKLERELRLGENVILDTRHLSRAHRLELSGAIEARGWSKRVLWYP